MSALENTFKVALSEDLLDALFKLPRTQQKKVQKFIRGFRRDPTSSAHNYETIQNAADPNMRSVRIDQAYRAIVLAPKQGNVYVMLYVANHDDAYDWAQRRRAEIHPETGSLQVFSVDEERYVEPSEVEDLEAKPLFEEVRDRELRRLGVPDDLLPVVRRLQTVSELEGAAGELPPDVYEALYWLSQGDSLETVLNVVVLDKEQEVDTEDFAKALENPQSQRKFVVVDDENLEQVLNASMEKWRVFLHPMQRKIVELDLNGPIRVLGGAGTGKTVVAMHRAVFLAREKFNAPNDRLLFTTFTSNLARDISENLRKLADPELMRRIEVVHLDQWVSDFLKGQGYARKIEYYQSGSGTLAKLWQEALGGVPAQMELPESFFREEWEYVVQAQGCQSLRDYLRARRTGRGVPLRGAQRRDIWKVFETYRASLNEKGLSERADALRDARALLKEKGDVLPYRAILLDEAQDMGEEAFKLIRQMIPEQRDNDLFIVGDGHQRIYRQPVVMKQCGINIQGRNHAHKLRINYRTTDAIRRFAVGILEGIDVDNLDGEVDQEDGYKSLRPGVSPRIENARDFGDEVDRIEAFIREVEPEDYRDTCLVARTNKRVADYKEALEKRGIPTHTISRQTYDDRSAPGVRVATMHRVKGLEFDRVIIAAVNKGVVPLQYVLDGSQDEMVRADLDTRERALFYVATTRARSEVLVTSYGERSGYLG
ncbi:AAA family ATPase [Lujinxingia vulgaris]|uniref:DNA 3'-5' helicase n=1 Tax=Lujinxingia vulgaris TaxID=2600176 RepID=A0A5C6X2R2_9DELT|nr:3'-5' exonuclease [Lujinxingia vulgaris]TXD33784.1 AAA family ATPase [Lujinxingia vulgaris]